MFKFVGDKAIGLSYTVWRFYPCHSVKQLPLTSRAYLQFRCNVMGCYGIPEMEDERWGIGLRQETRNESCEEWFGRQEMDYLPQSVRYFTNNSSLKVWPRARRQWLNPSRNEVDVAYGWKRSTRSNPLQSNKCMDR